MLTLYRRETALTLKERAPRMAQKEKKMVIQQVREERKRANKFLALALILIVTNGLAVALAVKARHEERWAKEQLNLKAGPEYMRVQSAYYEGVKDGREMATKGAYEGDN